MHAARTTIESVYSCLYMLCEVQAGCCGVLVLYQPVDVVLRAVLRRRHLEDVRDAQQGLLGVAVRHHLKWSSVLDKFY